MSDVSRAMIWLLDSAERSALPSRAACADVKAATWSVLSALTCRLLRAFRLAVLSSAKSCVCRLPICTVSSAFKALELRYVAWAVVKATSWSVVSAANWTVFSEAICLAVSTANWAVCSAASCCVSKPATWRVVSAATSLVSRAVS